MSILITGNHGFIGSWLNIFINQIHPNKIIGIDNRVSLGERLVDKNKDSEIIVNEQYNNDLSNLDYLLDIIQKHEITEIFHIAGQAIVPRCFEDPKLTFDSNVVSTFYLLEAARISKTIKKICLVTSDKVYKNENKNKFFKEDDVLGGKDIYSTSKVICEHLADSYRKIHLDKTKIVEVVRLGNVVGGGDYSVNRLLPDLIRSYLQNNIFEVRYPQATRPFQHVLDVCNGIYSILMKNPLHNNDSYMGDCWNLGPRNNTSMIVGDVINLFKSVFELKDIKPRKNSLPEDILLAVDNTKYVKIFGHPKYDSEHAVLESINWYKKVHLSNQLPWDLALKDTNQFLKNHNYL